MSEIGSYNFKVEGKEVPTDKIVRLRKTATEPILMVKQYFEQGASLKDVFLMLGDVADEFDDRLNERQVEGLEIDVDFQVILNACRNRSVDTPDFYHGMFSIFKRSGYSRDEIQELLSQYQGRIDTDSPKGMVIQVSQNTALTAVFGIDEDEDSILN